MTNITVDGPDIERDDGTIRCIGYGIDSMGRVTGRFALPSGHDWNAPDATQSVEFVESMDGIPPIDDAYREQP